MDHKELESEYNGLNEGFRIASEKLEAVRNHLKKYPEEKSKEYLIGRHYPSTAGSNVFNSVLFLTHLETWHKELLKILGVS